MQVFRYLYKQLLWLVAQLASVLAVVGSQCQVFTLDLRPKRELCTEKERSIRIEKKKGHLGGLPL